MVLRPRGGRRAPSGQEKDRGTGAFPARKADRPMAKNIVVYHQPG
jgi:hypothetical protein